MTAARLPIVTVHPLWSVAQLSGVVLTLGLLFALMRWPEPALHLLWEMVIPLLPALFQVNPLLHRQVANRECPGVATPKRRAFVCCSA